MKPATWAELSDRVLARLFVLGSPAPGRQELRSAYPFGERKYWPYKVWCARVKAWRTAHANGSALGLSPRNLKPADRAGKPRDTETLDVFEGAR